MTFHKTTTNQQGFSIIELMIALVLGLIITGAVTQVFISTNQTYRIQEAQARLQENGWAAIHYLTTDIRLADFWGCMQLRTDINSALDFTPGKTLDYINNPGISGINGAQANSSDAITIRKVSMQNTSLKSDMTDVSSDLSLSRKLFNSGDTVLITDCTHGDIFAVTGTNGNSVSHQVRHGGDLQNSSSELSTRYDTGAQLFEVEPVTYSIQPDNAGVPALFRQVANGNAELFIEDVSEMQILYGENTDDTQGANYYATSDKVTDMDRVQSVRITLSLNTNTGLAAPNSLLSQTFSTTIQIRNH